MQYLNGKEKAKDCSVLYVVYCCIVLLFYFIPKISCLSQNIPHNTTSFPKAKFYDTPQQVFF